jgi:hypothetical protein
MTERRFPPPWAVEEARRAFRFALVLADDGRPLPARRGAGRRDHGHAAGQQL